jgi:hypothetical protein
MYSELLRITAGFSHYERYVFEWVIQGSPLPQDLQTARMAILFKNKHHKYCIFI